MSSDLRPMLVWLVAYLAAGMFYVLRGLGNACTATKVEIGGLGFVILCWLPIRFGNLVSLYRTGTQHVVLERFCAETAPPLSLLVAIVVTVTSL